MRRDRNAKIVATLGPASSDESVIRQLFAAGVDVFRLNFSHGAHQDHADRVKILRKLEQEFNRPIAILLDLQGPKLRLGSFPEGSCELQVGAKFRLELEKVAGDINHASLPHPEIFAALKVGTELLIDDGKVRLRVDSFSAEYADTTVLVGGRISDRKGVNVPGVVLPISPLTPKDRADLTYGLELGVDWVALSFVQRAQDIIELREIVGDQAWIVAKLEKPSAIESLDSIIEISDGVMVARGDLGVEMPPEQVPEIQRRIIRSCRKYGKPVIVATQMLESMVSTPVPTRAEASDVANAIYDGADAVMLSAESASGKFPLEAVVMMNKIIMSVEHDPTYRKSVLAAQTAAQKNTPDAICSSLSHISSILSPAATVTYTSSGYSTLRAARERPDAPIIALTPSAAVARRLAMVWGVHPCVGETINYVSEMIACAVATAKKENYAKTGDIIVIVAGMPFGQAGTTNMIHVATV